MQRELSAAETDLGILPDPKDNIFDGAPSSATPASTSEVDKFAALLHSFGEPGPAEEQEISSPQKSPPTQASGSTSTPHKAGKSVKTEVKRIYSQFGRHTWSRGPLKRLRTGPLKFTWRHGRIATWHMAPLSTDQVSADPPVCGGPAIPRTRLRIARAEEQVSCSGISCRIECSN